MSRPSTRPTRTAPTGPWKGMPDRESAAEAPFSASTSGSLSRSAEIARQITCTSLAKPFGNSGGMARAIRGEVNTSVSTGRPPRSNCPPGLRPPPSPTDTELFGDGAVPLGVLLAQIFDQPAALPDQHEKASAGVMVLRVGLEMLREAVDPFRQEGDLDLWRPRVCLVRPKLLD